jgi:starch phosphorylase
MAGGRKVYNGQNGWAIGDDTHYDNLDQQDEVMPTAITTPLKKKLCRSNYTKRSADGLPGDWIQRIKECIRTISPQFSMTRMVKEYADDLYLPALLSARGEETPEE